MARRSSRRNRRRANFNRYKPRRNRRRENVVGNIIGVAIFIAIGGGSMMLAIATDFFEAFVQATL